MSAAKKGDEGVRKLAPSFLMFADFIYISSNTKKFHIRRNLHYKTICGRRAYRYKGVAGREFTVENLCKDCDLVLEKEQRLRILEELGE